MENYASVLLKILLLTLISFIFAPNAVDGRLLLVSQDGRGDFTTITDAANAAQPGDTVLISGGVYHETLRPHQSGTADNRITYTNVAGEEVIISDTDVGLDLNLRSYITVKGIQFENIDVFGSIYDGHHNEIAYCSFVQMRNYVQFIGFGVNGGASYNWIHHNTFSRWGYFDDTEDYGDMISIYDSEGTTSYNLFEENEVSYAGHAPFRLASRYNVVRNNYFHNEPWYDDFGNRGMEIAYHEGSGGVAEFNLIEGNRFGMTGVPSDAEYGAGMQLGAPHHIVRYNVFYYSAGPGLSLSTWFGEGDTRADYNHIYNNVFYKNGLTPTISYWSAGLVTIETGEPIIGNVIKQNIFYANNIQSFFWAGNQRDESLIPLDQVVENNLENVDPLFVDVVSPVDPLNAALPDFHLQATSPAVDTGIHLTFVKNSGNGTALTVDDAGYFSDGFGIVDADWIKIGNTDPVEIDSIAYDTNIINIGQSRSWSKGDPVYLYKNSAGTVVYEGAAPDVGAFEYKPTTVTLPFFLPVITK